MLTPQDVRAAQFEKNIRGYRTEEVDRFLDKVEEQLKQDEDQAEELRRQIAELTARISVCTRKWRATRRTAICSRAR